MSRILLADDQRAVLELLADRLRGEPDFEIVGQTTAAAEVAELAQTRRPDVVLMELHFGDRGAIDVAGDIARCCRDVRIVFLTASPADVLLGQAVRLRAGFLLKSESLAAVIAGVRRAAAGDVPYSVEVARRLTFDPLRRCYQLRTDGGLAGLTGRQVEVLRHLARGRSVKEVAAELHLSEKSIDSHKYRIMHKLDIHDRVELARYAIREGLIRP